MLKDTSTIAIEAASLAQHMQLISPSAAIIGVAKEFLHYTHTVEAGVNVIRMFHDYTVRGYYQTLARLYGTYISNPSVTNLERWIQWERSGADFYDRYMTDPVRTLYLWHGKELRDHFDGIRQSPLVRGDSKSLALLNALEARVLTAYYVSSMPRLWYVREGADHLVSYGNHLLLRGAAQLAREGKFDFEVVREFEQKESKSRNGAVSRSLIVGVSEAILSAFFFDEDEVVDYDFSPLIKKNAKYHELLDELLQWLPTHGTPIPELWSASYLPMRFETMGAHVRPFVNALAEGQSKITMKNIIPRIRANIDHFPCIEVVPIWLLKSGLIFKRVQKSRNKQ
jgi:hypothetical protein